MTPMGYGDDFNEKSFDAKNVYKESTLNDIFIKCVEASICRSFREIWAMHLQADMTNIAFKAQFTLAIQNGATKPVNSNTTTVS